MDPDEDTDPQAQSSTISSRPPYLPPCTPGQALDAILATPPTSGLASDMVSGVQSGKATPYGLASDLLQHGITSIPGCDPRLVNVTTDPSKPSFQTAKGTVIQMNKPAPGTSLPWGAGLDRLISFADNTGQDMVKISGGTEASGSGPSSAHTPNSVHPLNLAIDVPVGQGLDGVTVRNAALAAGYTHGIHEIKPDGASHWHLQVGPANIRNPSDYDLRNGPIRTKDYTQEKPQPLEDGDERD